ncbi:hypothetical protein CDL15_Pgr014039 [Punica granatum]|nr:hypothetical protein CDL15_Pgr014039 [Punica granatum]
MEIKIQEGLQKARGPATILALGTANPANIIHQADFPDFYFQVTNSDNMTLLKEKFKRICDKTMIKKRHMVLTRDLLERNTNMCAYGASSLNARQDILVPMVPELGKEAALKAIIEEWGLPKSKITHLIFHSTSGAHMPGADYHIIKLLGLQLNVKRIMMYQQGCYVSGTLLRMAKDIAENNPGARILVVCSEITLGAFHGPCEADLDSLVGQAIIGDGAAALIIGADPDASFERPLFQLVSALETIIPDSDGAIEGPLSEMGLTFHLSKGVPALISSNIEKLLADLLGPFGIVGDWNSLFWAIHTGGRAILDGIEAKLGLNQDKLQATRHVLGEYGNMGSASVFFVLDEVRRRSATEGTRKVVTEGGAGGRGNKWGILLAFGAGLTVDAVLLLSIPTDPIPN